MVKKEFLALVFLFSGFSFAVNNHAILSKTPEEKLSDYNFFSSLSEQTPHLGVHKYVLHTPLFSDYTDKDRFVYVPKNLKAKHVPNKVYDFPLGSSLIKTFSYKIAPSGKKRLLETRLLLLQEDGWAAHTYVWNESQTDAFLKVSGKTISGFTFLYKGKAVKANYRVPNQNQCKECHLSSGDKIMPIGPKSRNLNFDLEINGKIVNQIQYWIRNSISEDHIPEMVVANWEDEEFKLDDRARAYLDINCGHCHMKGGSADTTGLYLNYIEQNLKRLGFNKPPVAAGRASGDLKYSIVSGKPEESIMIYRMQSLDPGIMMPESGRVLTHEEGVKLIFEWIKSTRK